MSEKTDTEPLFSGKFLIDLALHAARSFAMDHMENCGKCAAGFVEMMSKNHGFASAPNAGKGFTEHRPEAKIIKLGDSGTCTPNKATETDNKGKPMLFGKYHFRVKALSKEDKLPWVYVDKGKKTVFDCNPQYFEANFTFAVYSSSDGK